MFSENEGSSFFLRKAETTFIAHIDIMFRVCCRIHAAQEILED